jgi:hypothetical protein
LQSSLHNSEEIWVSPVVKEPCPTLLSILLSHNTGKIPNFLQHR